MIVRPHEASAHREARYIIAVLDCLIRRATDAGYAGGPGTKGFFDEFASFMDLGSVGRYLNLGRTGKLQIHYVLQGRDQLEAAVGKTEARSIIQSTEIKCVGATTDLDLARMIAELSGQTRVDFRGAREGDEILGDWRDESRYLVNPQEITAQTEGQWTVVHRNQVYKREIPKRFYHHTQAAPPKEHPLWGWVDPETYRVPALRNPDDDPTPEDEDEYIA